MQDPWKIIIFLGMTAALLLLGWQWQSRWRSTLENRSGQDAHGQVQGENESIASDPSTGEPVGNQTPARDPQEPQEMAILRSQMVAQQLRSRDIQVPAVLRAMNRVPRQAFVPEHLRSRAYLDGPLPIGHDQTISQPYIVALMTQLARPTSGSKALDIGTGSGYQAAVLAEIVDRVFTIEIVEPLATQARERLDALGYGNIEYRTGDGYQGWPEQAPFDLIIVAAAPDHVPQPLLDQLAVGGRLVIPVGRFRQELLVFEKQADGTTTSERVAPVSFVPMTGQAQQP
ncbi:MAG: protein-L-isoaspartate(D-aspartate) O-methyltransferase [bacterium]|nr:protein-L-isoaspartate(D-aspartate) O-methyltransferase [bacterium]